MAQVHRLMPGAEFAGRYRVDAVIGQGTMGAVYRVREKAGGEVRALKVMKADLLTDDPKFPARFEQEARISERIKSPQVVTVFDSGVDAATGLPWLAMELLEGRTLDAYLAEAPRPPPEVARDLLDQLFAGAAAAHAANVVHRDLKPENVFLVGEPGAFVVKILDFGIAKVVRESTLAGTTPGLGTPLWTAPEQTREGQVIRPAADVWALGLLTFRLLTGKAYWRAANDPKSSAFDVAVELVRAPLVAASERARELGVEDALPPGFDAWFARAVVRDPDARFANAAEAHAALAPLVDARRGGRSGARTLVIAAAVALVVALALALARAIFHS
ncbi:MAG TPA: serine/threonine-protein kinase [Minicystis sp.]|nr:serine/threonine-protein kinase [Minicystis sp.]